MASIITVENLSKKYVIGHQKREQYSSLRDVLSNSAKRVLNGLVTGRFGQMTADSLHEEFWALKNINFEIQEGDRVGIIGRNGAGKSTLLKVLSRITEPTTGRVKINGRVASLLEVGTGFHPELTGRENIYLNGAILGMSKSEIKRRFDEIVSFAEIDKFLDTPVKRYSSGMYVRLAFSVAAHLEPEILIVDEVLAVGDAQFQKKCMGKMEERNDGGRTILFVSHNMNAIRTLCNKVIVLKDGSVLSYGETSDEISRYLSEANKTESLEKTWSDGYAAPQNSLAALKKIALCDAEGNGLSSIFTNSLIDVHIEFVLKVQIAEIGFTVIFYDKEGNCVFSSINNRDEQAYGNPLSQGAYVAICRIPANYFNNGWFTLSVIMFGKNFSDSHMVREVLGFQIHDSPEIRGDYHGDYAGCVRPALEWRMQKNSIEDMNLCK